MAPNSGLTRNPSVVHGRSALGLLRLIICCRALVYDNMALSGDFTPVLAKYSKTLNLMHSLEIGVSECNVISIR
jgi:hypothetical protein